MYILTIFTLLPFVSKSEMKNVCSCLSPNHLLKWWGITTQFKHWKKKLWTHRGNSHFNFFCPHQVLAALKESNFTLLNQRIRFDENGDPTFGFYSIVFWNQSGDAEEIGFYIFHPSDQLFINNTKILWNPNGEVSYFNLVIIFSA